MPGKLTSCNRKDRSYFFLDSWALTEYSVKGKSDKLVEYLQSKGHTAVINALSLIEVYNPGWRAASSIERGELIADLLARIPTVITDPTTVVRCEFVYYPERLNHLPTELKLHSLSKESRREALLRFLRADPMFVAQGKDIRAWVRSYEELKSSWSAEDVLTGGMEQGFLEEQSGRYVLTSDEAREEFLCSLDRRLFRFLSSGERKQLGTKIVELCIDGRTRDLPSVRLCSLLFLHHYVGIDPANRPRYSPSDSGDFWHLLLAPYCQVFTIDRNMKKLMDRVRIDTRLSTTFLDPGELSELLD